MQAGPYKLIRRLGAGGMGEVWMARRLAIGGAAKTVAVKMIVRDAHRKEADALAAREGFFAEARLSMLLTNSNIVQVFDVGEAEDGTPYMAMEWVDGLNLAELTDRLRERGERMPVPLCAYITGELLKGLAYAHELKQNGELHPIIHRDVSPHNVMISVAGEVKLMDFGIARMATEETSGQHIKGKVRYMSPEQLSGDTRGPTIDLFAVGAILHELLDGRKFRSIAVDEARLYGMVIKGEVGELSRPEDVPPELDQLRRALLANVAERIPSARAACRKLAEWPGYRDAKFDLEHLVEQLTTSPVAPLGRGLTQQLGNLPTVPRTDVLPSTSADKTLLDADETADPGLWNSRVRPLLDLSEISDEQAKVESQAEVAAAPIGQPSVDEQTWIEERPPLGHVHASEHAALVGEITVDTSPRRADDEQTGKEPKPGETDSPPAAPLPANEAAVTAVEPRPPVAAQTGPQAVVVPASRWRIAAVSAVLSLVGLGFGIFGVGELLGWWLSEDDNVAEASVSAGDAGTRAVVDTEAEALPNPPATDAEVAQEAPRAPLQPAVQPATHVEAEQESPPEPTPLPVQPTQVEPSPAPVPKAETSAKDEEPAPGPVSPKPEPKPTPKKFSVTVQLKGATYVQVQIDNGKLKTFNKTPTSPTITLKVAPGDRVFQWRFDESKPWSEKKLSVKDDVTLVVQTSGVTVK